MLKLTDKDFLRSLENAVRFGKSVLLENVLEELDPALEPILLKQIFKQQGWNAIKLGDAVIPYHDDFKDCDEKNCFFFSGSKIRNSLENLDVTL